MGNGWGIDSNWLGAIVLASSWSYLCSSVGLSSGRWNISWLEVSALVSWCMALMTERPKVGEKNPRCCYQDSSVCPTPIRGGPLSWTVLAAAAGVVNAVEQATVPTA